MRKLVIALTVCCSTIWSALGQTEIWKETFDPQKPSWTITPNTSDNRWVVNNSYLGGTFNGQIFGNIPVVNTPDQPSGITGYPQSNYLHINNYTILGSILSIQGAGQNNILNANYVAAGVSNEDAISPNIPTTGYTNIKVSYWWACKGDNASKGTVSYSIDNGATWTVLALHFDLSSDPPTWNYVSHDLPASVNNLATFQLKFNWTDGADTGAQDPAFSIDDIIVSGTQDNDPPPTGTCSITDIVLPPVNLCEGYGTGSYSITFTANTGGTCTFNSGNQFIIELSDASGNFSSPTTLGTINESTPGTKTQDCVIPNTLTASTGYKIRVRSTDPALTSSEVPFTVHPIPTVTFTPPSDVCITAIPISLSATGDPANGTAVFTFNGNTITSFDPASAGENTHTITCTYTANGCEKVETATITVHPEPTINFSPPANMCLTGTALTLSATGNPTGGTVKFTLNGIEITSFNPTNAGVGSHTILCTYTVNGCEKIDSATITVGNDCCGATGIVSSLSDTTVCASSFTVPTGILSNSTGAIHWTEEYNRGKFEDSLTQTPTFELTDNTIIHYKLYVHDQCGKDSIKLTLIPPPAVTLLTTDFCEVPKEISSISLDSVTWDANDTTNFQFTDDSSSVVLDVKKYTIKVNGPPGKHWLEYSLPNPSNSGCAYTDSIEIEFPTPPFVTVQDDSICPGASYQLYATGSEENLTYTWNTGFVGNPLPVTQPGTYWVKVKNACFESPETTAEIVLKTCKTDEIPNVISLGLSGVSTSNTAWHVPIEGAKEFECLILNRWGDVIYELKDVNDKWYGKDKSGNIVTEGVYFYKVTASFDNGNTEVKHGFIHVIH